MEDFFYLHGTMDFTALARLMREAPSVTSVSLSVDPDKLDALYDAVKAIPTVSGMGLQRGALANFRRLLAPIETKMGVIYAGFAAIIAIGVVYSSALIALSERARELASLRVLGFTRGEALRMLLVELGLLTVLAQPLGWAAGYLLSWTMK